MGRSHTELGLVLHPEDFATASCDTEVWGELDEGREGGGGGGRRRTLGLEADAHDVEGGYYKR
jgi:hypothetical protein